MTEHNNISDDKDFIRTQEMNSISLKQKRRYLVPDKRVPVLDIQDVEEPVSSTKEQRNFTKDIIEVKAKSEDKINNVIYNEVLKLYTQKLNELEKFRYKKDHFTPISFFDDVEFGPRSSLFDSALVVPFLTSFEGPLIEKQMKLNAKKTKDIQYNDKNCDISKVGNVNMLGFNFSGIYITMWMIFGWTALRGVIEYLILNNWRLNNIPIINLMTERLITVFLIDISMWVTSYTIVLIQNFIKWDKIIWEPTGRYVTIIFEIIYFFSFQVLVIFYFKMNWVSRIFFFLHCLVLLMKMHSYSFCNGYLWNVKEELNFSKWALSKHKDFVSSKVFNTLQKSQTFCEYELSRQSRIIQFPNNICFKNYTLFCFYPTLVYQVEYPRSKNIRWIYVFEKFCAIIGVLCLMVITSQLYLYPYVINTVNITAKNKWPDLLTSTKHWFYLLVDVLPGFSVIFLLTFYFIWDALLNCVSELTRFADRYFYGDWWNCVSFTEWSRIWNVPVHKFLLRHIFHSSMKHWKLSSTSATWVTFGLSSLLHEFSMYVIFLKIRPYMFFFQMSQLPTTYLSKRPPFKDNQALCNILFIFALYFGMSTILCLYLVY